MHLSRQKTVTSERANNMQLQSKTSKDVPSPVTVDYYQIKGTDQVRLRVITFLGKTLNKTCIEVHDMAREIDNLLLHNFAVTVNTNRPRQIVPVKEVAQCLTHYHAQAL